MTRLTAAMGFVAIAALGAAGCGGSAQPGSETAPATTTSAPTAGGGSGVDITFTSTPTPPRAGENTFEVAVVGADGQPVTDAEVTADFYMAAMPSMNMPEMRNRVALAHQGSGRYRGTGSVPMAGGWDVTVRVNRDGREIGRETLTIAAQ